MKYHSKYLLYAPLTSQALQHQAFRSKFNCHDDAMSAMPPIFMPAAAQNFEQWRTSRWSHSYNVVRHFQLGCNLYDNPSSKIEETVQTMKKQQKEKVEEILKEANASASSTIMPDATMSSLSSSAMQKSISTDKTSAVSEAQNKINAGSTSQTQAQGHSVSSDVPSTKAQDFKPVVVKKSLKTRIWEELVHYYHGFRLLFIDINICRKLLWRVLNGKKLTRRENTLLVRTTSDLFRLIPFSVFIIVPFMELLLPLFIKFFPGMLPSTFQTTKDRENKLKQSLQVKLEMAKFLQKTLDEMAVVHQSEHKSEEAKQFVNFFQRIKNPNEYVSKEELIKYASRFKDEITLDSLSREQLAALCRLLEINTMGTTNFLRFQLRVKLRSLAADDRVIAREGVQSLDLYELQQACKARGMRAYGLTSERLHAQLQEWIDLSLNEKVPPTLLLLSRAMFISDDHTTADKLKQTIRVLPDSVAAQTKAAIGELEGKIDNKTKIEIIKEEERKIKEERDEEQEEEKAKTAAAAAAAATATTEELVDKAPQIITEGSKIDAAYSSANESVKLGEKSSAEDAEDKTLSSKDVELLSEALRSLSSDKKKMMIEKEQIKEIKEELEDYKEDVEELHEVRNVVQEPVQESRAAKMLFKKVNKMLGQLDKVLDDLERKQREMQQLSGIEASPEQELLQKRQQEIVHISELMNAIKKVQQTSTESRLGQIESILSKLDSDKDGVVTVDEVLKVIEALGRENIKLDNKLVEEVITLLDKEQLILAEEKIEKAIAKSIKEAEIIKAKKQRMELRRIAQEQALYEELKDKAPELRDNATDLDEADNKYQELLKFHLPSLKEQCSPQASKRLSQLYDDESKTKLQQDIQSGDDMASSSSTPPGTPSKPTQQVTPAPLAPTTPASPPPPPPSATASAPKTNTKDKML